MNNLNYYFLILIIALCYLFYYIVIKNLLLDLSLKDTLINLFIYCALIILIIYNKYTLTSIKKTLINSKQLLLILLLAIIIVITNYFLIYACNYPMNFGKIDAFASAIYLPLVTLVAYLIYNQTINNRDILGIFFACLSIYFLS